MEHAFPEHPRFALVGAGAVGCYYGGRLVQHGNEMHFLLRSDYDVVRERGLHVESCAGDFDLAPSALNVYSNVRDMPKVDVVLVTLKTTANAYYQELIHPLLGRQTCILTLQNGLGNEQRLAELFGEERVIGGLAFTCINRVAPGHIRHSDYGLIKIGELVGGVSARLKRISEIFNAAEVSCRMLDDLAMGRWEKLLWNVPFNGLGAALNLTTDRLVNSPAGRELVREIMHEIVRTAHAAGIMIDPALIEQNVLRTQTMGPYKSSMQIDREMNRPIELDAIIGNPMRAAKKHEVSVPKLEMLYQMLSCI